MTRVLLGLFILFASILFGSPSMTPADEPHSFRSDDTPQVRLEDNASESTISYILGPFSLPAHSHPVRPYKLSAIIPFEAWLMDYETAVENELSRPVPGQFIHHITFYNTRRRHLICPQRAEPFFSVGTELTKWPTLPNAGYKVAEGDRIRIEAMVHNPGTVDHSRIFVRVKMRYEHKTPEHSLRTVYPVIFYINACGSSAYDLRPGENLHDSTSVLRVSGRLLAAGGHMHDYGQWLKLENLTQSEEIIKLNAHLASDGRLLSMPVVSLLEKGGYQIRAGDVLKVTARYDNPTGRYLPQAAMGMLASYFLPDNEEELSAIEAAGR